MLAIANVRESPATDARCIINEKSLVIFTTGPATLEPRRRLLPLLSYGGVLQYNWEAYCDTNGRRTDSISLSSERRGARRIAIQIGGVLQYKLEAYRDTFLRSSGGCGF